VTNLVFISLFSFYLFQSHVIWFILVMLFLLDLLVWLHGHLFRWIYPFISFLR